MADKKFSQFLDGNEMQVGDQTVGLRSGDNYRFDFPGLGVKDSSGAYMLQWDTPGAAAVNSLKVISANTGVAPQITAAGSDANINIALNPKGTGSLVLDNLKWPTSDGASGSLLYTDGALQLAWSSAAFPVTPGASGTIIQSNGTNWITSAFTMPLTFDSKRVVYVNAANTLDTIAPTLGGVLVTNGTGLGEPSLLANPGANYRTLLSTTNAAPAWSVYAQPNTAGTSGQIVTTNGTNWVYTTATFPSAAGAAGTVLRSNGTGWVASTATFADTYSASTLLYSNGANTVTGLATANSATLVTNSSGVPAWTSSMTNGQLLIGNTGNTPTLNTLTAGTGITISNTAGSITISGTGSGYTWTEVTGTSQAMAADSGYIANNAGLVTLTLPSTAAVGTSVIVQGKGAGGWRIAQNSGQTIRFGSVSTTTGVAGNLSSTNRYDSVELLCITANTDWAVLTAPQGIIDYA